jgi:hypothetical protein
VQKSIESPTKLQAFEGETFRNKLRVVIEKLWSTQTSKFDKFIFFILFLYSPLYYLFDFFSKKLKLHTLKKKVDFLDDFLNAMKDSLDFFKETWALAFIGITHLFIHGVEGYDALDNLNKGKQQLFNLWILTIATAGMAFAMTLFAAYAIPGAAANILIPSKLLLPISYGLLVTVFFSKLMHTIHDCGSDDGKTTKRDIGHSLVEFLAGAGVLTGILMHIFAEYKLFDFLGMHFGVSAVIIISSITVALINENLKEVETSLPKYFQIKWHDFKTKFNASPAISFSKLLTVLNIIAAISLDLVGINPIIFEIPLILEFSLPAVMIITSLFLLIPINLIQRFTAPAEEVAKDEAEQRLLSGYDGWTSPDHSYASKETTGPPVGTSTPQITDALMQGTPTKKTPPSSNTFSPSNSTATFEYSILTDTATRASSTAPIDPIIPPSQSGPLPPIA